MPRGRGRRAAMGPWRLGRVTCWVTAAAKLTPPSGTTSAPTPASRTPASRTAGLPSWACVLTSAWHGLSGGGAGHGGLFLCSLDGWQAGGRAGGQQMGGGPVSLGPSSGREEGLQPVALLPEAQQGPQLVLPGLWLWVGARGAGFFWGRLAASVPPPRPGRGRASGWRIFSSQYGKGGREHR